MSNLGYTAAPYSYAATPYTWAAPAVSASQYHAQDELGQASYGYAYPGQAASNVRDAFGKMSAQSGLQHK